MATQTLEEDFVAKQRATADRSRRPRSSIAPHGAHPSSAGERVVPHVATKLLVKSLNVDAKQASALGKLCRVFLAGAPRRTTLSVPKKEACSKSSVVAAPNWKGAKFAEALRVAEDPDPRGRSGPSLREVPTSESSQGGRGLATCVLFFLSCSRPLKVFSTEFP